MYTINSAKDRRRREGETERENGQQPEAAEVMMNDRPEQAAGGEEFAMNDNTAYSTLNEETEAVNKE